MGVGVLSHSGEGCAGGDGGGGGGLCSCFTSGVWDGAGVGWCDAAAGSIGKANEGSLSSSSLSLSVFK